MRFSFWAIVACAAALVAGAAEVKDGSNGLVYRGIARGDIEVFLGIPYAQDTSGVNRFKPPRPVAHAPGTTIVATEPGPACPQPLGQYSPPLAMVNITEVSEDCLNLNIARPKDTDSSAKLPVMLWIHGGSFWYGSNMEPTTAPGGLIKQSIENGYPILHVAINYRLGFFGFAQSDTLRQEGSENAGLRDQRLAIEWVKEHIASFGGDPDRITILGQSSGGLSIGMQLLAYGGTKPLPFLRGVAQSQSLEPGITSNFTIDAMKALADHVGCDAGPVHSPETVACFRGKDTDTLLKASIATYASDIAHNIGDVWLPSVDGDFLPAAPSQLISEGRFGKAFFMTGWTQDDLNFYTNTSIATAEDTHRFIRDYLPGLTESSLEKLLALYPSNEFLPGKDLSAEFYRSGRMFRDILMVCPSIWLGAAVAKTHRTPVYHYNFNQTIVDSVLAAMTNKSGLGVGHTSEFAYIFDSFNTYNEPSHPVIPTPADCDLMRRSSRSWSTFAALGYPSFPAGSPHDTLRDWLEAYSTGREATVMTIGGPHEGPSAYGGQFATPEMKQQRLEERCGFLNDPAIIAALGY